MENGKRKQIETLILLVAVVLFILMVPQWITAAVAVMAILYFVGNRRIDKEG